MSPRPRQTSDEAILMATMRVMQRRSPVDLPLADVAKEAGVVPATLIQRFGTKRGLLLAVCRTAPGGVPKQFAAARAKYGSPLKTLIELYAECSGFASTPEAMANGLAYLQIDLIDPAFHAITLAQFTAIRDATKKSSHMMLWLPTNPSPATPPIWLGGSSRSTAAPCSTGPSTAKGPWPPGSAVLSKVCWLPTGSERRQTCPRPELDECKTSDRNRS